MAYKAKKCLIKKCTLYLYLMWFNSEFRLRNEISMSKIQFGVIE